MSELQEPLVDGQLRLVTQELLRMQRWSLALRPLSVVAVSALVVLHAPMNPSRYMFTAGLVAVASWLCDASLARRAAALRALREALRDGGERHAAALRMDLDAFDGALGWRRAVLGGARARWFLPMVLLCGAVAIDAQRFGPEDVPGELVWYLVLLLAALGAGSLVAWSWWLDRFGDEAPARTPASTQVRVDPATPARTDATLRDDGDLARWVPKHDPNERPFPEAPRASVPAPPPQSGTTQTFATVEAPAMAASSEGPRSDAQ